MNTVTAKTPGAQERRELPAGWRWGKPGEAAKVIDRLSSDLREAFPDMKGLSPRNLKYMWAFAEAWPDRLIVQQLAAQLPWFHNCLLLDKLVDHDHRKWYALAAAEILPTDEEIGKELAE